ncbi:hypothetical protein SODALDRAFT_347045 [Sodiomyces alkalinus F11]|uniref:ubiquitinyl hydrolase 1 n=1 Tax=Sodiomyces alkalinus (strain CBS 110278 / VKM F-3762 / F11) TaxID=1314773 RepID=A0A3N2Q558_SODAK|nr:hypothetical protein SODALDRAFT_347045 [Sodiomyces alkalinus F11]ROT41910.1 hypothetical protein SODALDRAFT_347045 [Sodiomyces alkalinus F11]
MDASATKLLEAVFEHLVLPPQLPGAFDGNDTALTRNLGERLQAACASLRHAGDTRVWDTVEVSLKATRSLNHNALASGDIRILHALSLLTHDGAVEWLAVHVIQQNAAILIHRAPSNDCIVFEAFRVAAPAPTVLEANHALVRTFPDRAVAIPPGTFSDGTFMDTLIQFLEQASSESFDRFASRAMKGGKSVVESRDFANPALISEMLMSLLEGMGQPVDDRIHKICKKVRDDVVLASAEIPWRRSPYWLVLRVALCRLLATLLSHSDGRVARVYFKFIMCRVLADFLNESVGLLHPEKILMLQAKLCRRLAKLDSERSSASGPLRASYDDFFTATSVYFEGIVEKTRKMISSAWENHKQKTIRHIPPLPLRAPDSDLVLSLPYSGAHLQRLASQGTAAPTHKVTLDMPSLGEGTVSQVNHLATKYSALIDFESTVITEKDDASVVFAEKKCEKLAESIQKYLLEVDTAYNDDATLMSAYLLKLFELWVAMDQAATTACPLLCQYHPIFVPAALDVLCLATADEMCRLRDVQTYLASRIESCSTSHNTILSDPKSRMAFPMQYVHSTQHGKDIETLGHTIDSASMRSADAKHSELSDLTDQYNQLTEDIRVGVCTCTFYANGGRDVRGCTKCWKWRSRKKLKITAHEDFLPPSTKKAKAHRAAVLFELAIPAYLAGYRMATWKLQILGCRDVLDRRGNKPVLLLNAFGQLRSFWDQRSNRLSLTLGSETKSFLQTHYKEQKLPTTLGAISLPFGPKFSYYDSGSGVWASELLGVPWYQHLLGTWLPRGISDPYENSALAMQRDVYAPTSYEIAADEHDVPSDMSCHEFNAFRRAVSARGRRWLVLLVELGATNINFSSETTMALFHRLSLQAGPAVQEGGVLREAHVVFRDPTFCARLCGTLHCRLDALVSSWREVYCMSTIITLSLRLYYLCPAVFQETAYGLLSRTRQITADWLTHLRSEVRLNNDAEAVRKAATYAFWAALLCRQTFAIYHHATDDQADLDSTDLLCFFRASIALQENLLVNLQELAPTLRQMLIRDLSTSHAMRRRISKWFSTGYAALEDAINETWTDVGGLSKRSFGLWQPASYMPCDSWWRVSRTQKTKFAASQAVHYHLLQGHLLVDGKPLGRLPLQMREDPGIQELFPSQHLLTRSSNLAGMEYQLVNSVFGHQIHFGFRDNQVVVRAVYKGSILELVPRTNFGNGLKGPQRDLDLPSGLVDDCVHWLNLQTGKLEMRRKPRVWAQRPGNWVLDVRKRLAVRNQSSRTRGFRGMGPAILKTEKLGSYLVEPRSGVGKQIADIFRDFEDTDKLTIYQTPQGRLSVEMKRLEIRFHVNNQKRLQCSELKSEIAENQDAGTFYGLTSKLVLQNVANALRRSILVPIGPEFFWKKQGMHVAVRVANNGSYARFSVDEVLGRLRCAPEPLHLYLKALLHAVTSFPLPDGLTGRTGTEEAFHCLRSASSQPWTPLNIGPRSMLTRLQSLSPKRVYYPAGSKIYQKVAWNDRLTATVQHEGLASLASSILEQSRRLDVFRMTTGVPTQAPDTPRPEDKHADNHLVLRGLIRRQIYERINSPSEHDILVKAAQVTVYAPEDRACASKQSCQVYQTVKALGANAGVTPSLPKLTPLLQTWNTIGGFSHGLPAVDIPLLLDGDISVIWPPLVQSCRQLGIRDSRSSVVFRLAFLAYGEKTDMGLVRWLVELSQNARLRDIEPPEHPTLNGFRPFEEPCVDSLRALLLIEQMDRNNHNLPTAKKGKKSEARKKYVSKMGDEASEIASLLVDKWPQVPRSANDFERLLKDQSLGCFIDHQIAWTFLSVELQRLLNNLDLSRYLQQLETTVEEVLNEQGGEVNLVRCDIWSSKPTILKAPTTALTLPHDIPSFMIPRLTADLTLKSYDQPIRHSVLLTPRPEDMQLQSHQPGHWGDGDVHKALSSLPPELSILRGIVDGFSSSANPTRKQYGKDLQESLLALIRDRMTPRPLEKALPFLVNTEVDIAMARKALRDHSESIQKALSRGSGGFGWLSAGNLWPCLSPVALLEQLRNDTTPYLGPGMKEALVTYGFLVTKLQRLIRMRDAQLCHNSKRFLEEQRHEGHSNWNPADHPEWLLLEIDNDILIRKPQVDVARAIISPASGNNSVLQMNMGQGKTSCIMPMAVVMLADKTQLCRLIVPRALLLQTAQVIQSRLGGLVGRVVRHIPYSRRSSSQPDVLNLYQTIHRDTLGSGGVMLCLPEHIMSFKLSGLQLLADRRLEAATKMVEIQRWLNASCRDVLDESDFTLSAKTQLIYPSGPQTAVDGHPHRWLVIEEVLSLVEGHTSLLRSRFPRGIEVVRRHQGYPIIHFLHTAAEDALNDLLVADVCAGRLSGVQLKNTDSEAARKIIETIIVGVDVPEATWIEAAESLTDDVFGLKNLYLLRGLISQRILLLCLKKRWNVQYGLHPDRAPIAVPFEAKGIPSQTAEYGHPDTALVLTCLAFYQTGVTKGQISQSLQHVIKSDDPAARYERWINGSDTLPVTLRHWHLVNADDEAQVDELWQHLRFDRIVLNHYMNNFVFPAHAKQFSIKLQASGWDIPLFSTGPRRALTTGFSGTNDNKGMLPQNIKQDDLPSLLQTNAEVLSSLLEPRNSRCIQAVDRDGRHLTEKGLLELLHKEKIRILIDAGAHILEQKNEDLAQQWLDIDTEAQGAVYLGRNSQIMVRARYQKGALPLLASPFADSLETCVVYIDEAHTRGTDLKLPPNARGAVTLGLGQTKDQTVQAAMRLRQLGSTQSVAFVAPPEVYRSVLDLRPSKGNMNPMSSPNLKRPPPVTSVDVVRWLLEQSCQANEHMMSLHIAQGFDFCRRTNALWKHSMFLADGQDRAKLLDVIRQREEQTLEQLYGPKHRMPASSSTGEPQSIQADFPRLQAFVTNLLQQKRALLSDGRVAHSSAFEEVEQEREVEFEVEQVRENQKPVSFLPHVFPGLSDSLKGFVKTGFLDSNGSFVQAFEYLGDTKIGRKFGVEKTSSRLFVTQEFCKTIIPDKSRTERSIMRPVEWILWSPVFEIAVVVIPEEAELLLPRLRRMEKPQVWLLSYAAPVTKSMRIFNSFGYFIVPSGKRKFKFPSWLGIEVGVLAGRLYFDYSEYGPLLTWLGVSQGEDGGSTESTSSDDTSVVESESASSTASTSSTLLSPCGLAIKEPLKFLLEWLTHRRQTDDIMHTPMGFICQRRRLPEDHTFFSTTANSQDFGAQALSRGPTDNTNDDDEEDSDDESDWDHLDHNDIVGIGQHETAGEEGFVGVEKDVENMKDLVHKFSGVQLDGADASSDVPRTVWDEPSSSTSWGSGAGDSGSASK